MAEMIRPRAHASFACEQRDELKISSLVPWLLAGQAIDKPIDTAGSGFGGRIYPVRR
jgi:hypothetical protein